MEQSTHLADCIDSTEYESKYDSQAKNLTANKQVLARILKDTVEELREYDLETIESCIEGTPLVSTIPVMPGRTPKEKIIGENTESTIVGERTVRFDIRFYVILPKIGDWIKIILNLELQKEYRLPYDLSTRAVFYCARMLSEQADTEFAGDHYEDIKKTYSIWVCTNVPEKIANTISEYKITREEVYGEFDEEEYYDLLTVVMIRLSGQEKIDAQNELLKMLTILYSHKLNAAEKKHRLKEEFGMRMTKKMERSLEDMCNLSQGIKEAGIRQGIRQGISQGISQGVKHSLRILLKRLGEIPDDLCKKIQGEEDLTVLDSWLMHASSADTMENFIMGLDENR